MDAEPERLTLPEREFDAVDYFVHERGRPPAPPPTLAFHLDSGLDQPGMAAVFGGVVADLAELFNRTAHPAPAPHSLGFSVRLGRLGGGRYTHGTVAELLGELRAGTLDRWEVTFAAGRTDSIAALIGQALPDRPDASVQLSLIAHPPVWPPQDCDAVAEHLLDLVRNWAGPLDLLWGAVTLDQGGTPATPYERWYRLRPHDTAPLAREYARGYYWANLLTAGHLARIGSDGLQRRAADDGIRVEPVADVQPGRGTVIVRSTAPISQFDDERLAVMKQLLAPVLIPAQYRQYEGYPLRIIPDPGTAFRTVPPGTPRPLLTP